MYYMLSKKPATILWLDCSTDGLAKHGLISWLANKGVRDFTDTLKLQVFTSSFPVNVTLNKNTSKM